MKKLNIFIAAVLIACTASAQKTVNLQINHKLGTDSFALNKEAKNNIGTSFNVSRLEYYISEISIVHDRGTETKIKDFWILENAANSKKHSLGQLNITSVDSIKFSIGVNKEVNHADPSQYALGHPLAPKSPSMHWGWASGYRFVAIEGKAGLDLNKHYEIHAIGDQYYYNQSIPVTASDDNGDLLIELNADYELALKNIDVSKNVITHGDFDEAVDLLQNFWTDVFSSNSGAKNTLKTSELEIQGLSVYPNPSVDGQVHFDFEKGSNVSNIQLFSLQGKLLSEYMVSGATELSLQLSSGMYIARISGANGQYINKKLVIQ